VLEAFAQVETVPNLLMVDGQGVAHPRGFGIACHLGVLLDLPSIRGAKSRLYGRYEAAGLAEGAVTDMPLTDSHGQVIGSVMRTNPRTNPRPQSQRFVCHPLSRRLPARLPSAGTDPAGA
jgi:deoxyribonuclease V